MPDSQSSEPGFESPFVTVSFIEGSTVHSKDDVAMQTMIHKRGWKVGNSVVKCQKQKSYDLFLRVVTINCLLQTTNVRVMLVFIRHSSTPTNPPPACIHARLHTCVHVGVLRACLSDMTGSSWLFPQVLYAAFSRCMFCLRLILGHAWMNASVVLSYKNS